MSAANRIKQLASHLPAWAVAALFLAAAAPKIAAPDEFAKAVHAYKMLPDGLVNLAALFLPWWELVAAIAIVAGARFRRAGLWICLVLLVVFTAAQTINIFRGVKGTCGCFGSKSKPIGWTGVLMNSGFIAVGAVALAIDSRRRRTGA